MLSAGLRALSLTVSVAAVLGGCAGASQPEPAKPQTGQPSSSMPVLSTLSSADAQPVLQQTWRSYARTFISGDGRVTDPSDGNTTSEGESYAMLRAVWMNDRTTFDSVWTWTQSNLWRNGRFAYLWNGSIQDGNSATDADQDIALALIFAAHQWQDSAYLSWAKQILQSVWTNDVATVGGVPYADAGNWAVNGAPTGPVLDPSYFAPYAYRIFAATDTSHPWSALVASSYAALQRCSQANLGTGAAVGLPPDWCVLNAQTGAAESFTQKQAGDDYGYDAFRVMWRVALDALWFNSQQAVSYLRSQTFLRSQWAQHGSLAAVYSHGGSAVASYEDPAVYGGDIGAFLVTPALAAALLQQKLLGSAHIMGAQAYFGESTNYYQQNWVWFGIGLATGRLLNLAAVA